MRIQPHLFHIETVEILKYLDEIIPSLVNKVK